MKFTDGNWLIRKGVSAHYAAEAHRIERGEHELKILAPTWLVKHKTDTLQGPLLTVRLSSPMADVVRVRATHFEGNVQRAPQFEIQDENPPVDIGDRSITSGKLTARLTETGWEIEFVADRQTITRSPAKALAYMLDEGRPYMQEQLSIGVGENVYGLGERFTAFVKNGQVVDIWNRDGGTNSEQAYKNIPFFMTNRGYGVFVNDPGPVSFEVASERSGRVGFSVPGETLEYFVIYGPTPKEILEKYTRLTGRPALPPAWSFGLWLSTSFTTDYNEETVTSFVQGMADRDIPLSVFHFDCFWMRAFHWTDLVWDPAVFSEPKAMLARMHERGLKICVWINPYIAQASRLFEEGREGGFLLKKPNGDVLQGDEWQPGMALVDFTNPAACAWFQERLSELIDDGVDALKTDFGERIPTDVAYFDGSDPVRMHNYYTLLYNRCVYEVLKRKKGEAVLFARSATTGGQQYPIHWGGDCYTEYGAMAESLRGGLSLGLCGFGFWSHDIGGFEGLPPAAIYKRWVAFGLLSSHSRLHGSSSYRVPWNYDDEACDVLRFFTQLKCRLMPYLFSMAMQARDRGVPVMRAMLLEFPDDPTCQLLDRQYMLGDSLLVAPVFSEEGEVEFFVPEGRWTSLLDGRVLTGPGWVRETHGFMSVPLLVRPGTILALGGVDDRPDYDYAQGVTFEVYELQEGVQASCSVPTLRGDLAGSCSALLQDGRVHVEIEGRIVNWTVRLNGANPPTSASGSGPTSRTVPFL